MVKKTYRPFEHPAHLIEWMHKNCATCQRYKSKSLPDEFPEVGACELLVLLSNQGDNVIDHNTAFLIGFADLDGDECGNHIWPCLSKIDCHEADMEKE